MAAGSKSRAEAECRNEGMIDRQGGVARVLEGGTAEIALLDRSSRVWMKKSTESKGDERARKPVSLSCL